MTDRKPGDWAGNIAALIVVLVVNALANILPIAGITTGGVSDKYSSLFTPAGYTFGIWGLIYLALVCFAVYQALPAQRGDILLARISKPFVLSCTANTLWIFAWHLEWIMVSLLFMLVLLAALIRIYRALNIDSAAVPVAHKLFVHLPFSLYTAWVSVATIANLSAMQAALGWNDALLSGIDWTHLKIAIAGAIAAAVVMRNRDFVFALVVAWAAFGIASGQAAAPAVAGAATVVGMAAVLLSLYEFVRRARRA